jgi:hypothetical protein
MISRPKPNPDSSLGVLLRALRQNGRSEAGYITETEEPEFNSGSSDTRSTLENGISIPNPLSPACHQLWLHGNGRVEGGTKLGSGSETRQRK